jgi:hypothetical protein
MALTTLTNIFARANLRSDESRCLTAQGWVTSSRSQAGPTAAGVDACHS